MRFFYKHDTTDYILLWSKTQSDCKEHEFKAVSWNNLYCKVFLLSEREISLNYTDIFLDFVRGFGSYVKGLPKTKRCDSVAVTNSVRFGFGVYVKRPLRRILYLIWKTLLTDVWQQRKVEEIAAARRLSLAKNRGNRCCQTSVTSKTRGNRCCQTDAFF